MSLRNFHEIQLIPDWIQIRKAWSCNSILLWTIWCQRWLYKILIMFLISMIDLDVPLWIWKNLSFGDYKILKYYLWNFWPDFNRSTETLFDRDCLDCFYLTRFFVNYFKVLLHNDHLDYTWLTSFDKRLSIVNFLFVTGHLWITLQLSEML